METTAIWRGAGSLFGALFQLGDGLPPAQASGSLSLWKECSDTSASSSRQGLIALPAESSQKGQLQAESHC